MANARKAQGDIDKLLKKIQEGIDDYEELYSKFEDAATPALKERFEGDLKKEIKKLQRLREQVKVFIQSPEVKDTKALEINRRRIEEKMEAFKVVERETKTKTFSKEGLANLRNDSSETPQAHTEAWIKSSISDLKEQTETAEFELQSAGGKKKKGREDPREIRLQRLKYNTLKLEQLLRLVVNEDLQPEEVDEIESSVQRFIDENAEEDFEEEEDLYDRFDLPEVVTRVDVDEEEPPAAPAPAPKKAVAPSPAAPAAAKTVKAPPTEGGRVVVPAPRTTDTPPTNAAKAPTTPIAVKTPAAPSAAAVAAGKKVEPLPPAVATPAAPTTTPSAPATPATPFATKVKMGAAAQPTAAAAPAAATAAPTPVAPAAAAPAAQAAAKTPSSAVTSANASRSIPSQPPTVQSASKPFSPNGKDLPQLGGGDQDGGDGLDDDGLLDDDMDMANDDTFGDDAMPVNNTASLADMASATTNLASDWEKGRPTFAQKVAGNNVLPSQQQPPAPQQQQQPSVASPAAPASAAAATRPGAAASPAQVAPAGNPVSTAAVWTALLKQQPTEEKVAVQRMLEMSIANLPHPHDMERVRPFVPPNPYKTPDYYPQTVHPGFTTGELFKKFDQDTLFFVFYYQQATYQQYVAAKQLKAQAYRYHKKFKTWFQRHNSPTKTTEEYESGAYLYFDYENGWCQRIKNDFMFKYQYLEDELV